MLSFFACSIAISKRVFFPILLIFLFLNDLDPFLAGIKNKYLYLI